MDSKVRPGRMYGKDLISAIMERDEEKAKLLIVSKNANTDFKHRGDMAIHLAARYGLMRILRWLLRSGDDVNKGNENGNTAVHYAARDGLESMVVYLKGKGADLNKQNKDGETALHYCVGYQPMDVIERFIAMGMDVNIQNMNGDTPLHVAVAHSRDESVEALLLCDADPSITNHYNKRPDQLARDKSIGVQIRTYRLLSSAMESGYIMAQGMKISHKDVEKPKHIERVGITLESIDLPTDFPTTFYCRREKSENTTVKFTKDTDEEIISDVFHFRVRDAYRDIDAKITLPIYTAPSEKERMFVRFVLGKGGKKIVSDIKEIEDENGQSRFCTIEAVLVPETTCACVMVAEPKAQETLVGDEAMVVRAETECEFALDIPEGTFEANTTISLKVFDAVRETNAEESEREDDEEERDDEKNNTENEQPVPDKAHAGDGTKLYDYESEKTIHEDKQSITDTDQVNSENEGAKPEIKVAFADDSNVLSGIIADSESDFKNTENDIDQEDDELQSEKRKRRKRKQPVLLSDVYEINISGQQPAKGIKMQIPLHSISSNNNNNSDNKENEFQIIRVDATVDEDTPVQSLEVDTTVVGNNIEFEAKHFSMYVVAPRECTNLDKIHGSMLIAKERKQKARFFAAVLKLSDSGTHVLLVECIKFKKSRERRRYWEDKGFEKQKPKHSKRILLAPSQEFCIRLKGDAKFDDKAGETGDRRLMFSPHRASYQPFQIKLTPQYSDGKASVLIYRADTTDDKTTTLENLVKDEEELEPLAKLKIKMELPPLEDAFGENIEDAFTYDEQVPEPELVVEPVTEPEESSDDDDIPIIRQCLPKRPESARDGVRYTKSAANYPTLIIK